LTKSAKNCSRSSSETAAEIEIIDKSKGYEHFSDQKLPILFPPKN